MKVKRLAALSMAGIILALAVGGCGKNSNIYNENGKVSLRMAQTSAADGAIGISMETFAEDVKEKSKGRIEI